MNNPLNIAPIIFITLAALATAISAAESSQFIDIKCAAGNLTYDASHSPYPFLCPNGEPTFDSGRHPEEYQLNPRIKAANVIWSECLYGCYNYTAFRCDVRPDYCNSKPVLKYPNHPCREDCAMISNHRCQPKDDYVLCDSVAHSTCEPLFAFEQKLANCSRLNTDVSCYINSDIIRHPIEKIPTCTSLFTAEGAGRLRLGVISPIALKVCPPPCVYNAVTKKCIASGPNRVCGASLIRLRDRRCNSFYYHFGTVKTATAAYDVCLPKWYY